MGKQLVERVFDALRGLEACLDDVKAALAVAPRRKASRYTPEVAEYARLLAEMRRHADDVAKHTLAGNWELALRSFRLYHGLSVLVRSPLVALFARLHNARNPFGREEELTCH